MVFIGVELGKSRFTVKSNSSFQTLFFTDFKKGRKQIKGGFLLSLVAIFVQIGQPFLFPILTLAVEEIIDGVLGCDFCCVLTLPFSQPVLEPTAYIGVGSGGIASAVSVSADRLVY